MGVQIFSRQLLQREVEDNTDETIAFCPLPTGAKLNNTWMDVSVIADAPKGYKGAAFYGITGYVLEIDDPETATTLNAIWDSSVSKETSRQGSYDNVSLDDASSAIPESSPTFFDLDELLGTNNQSNIEVFKRRKMITFAKNPVGWDPASGGTYIPTDTFTTHLKGGPRVDRMSYLLFGFSSPLMDNRATGEPTVIAEASWFHLQFLDMFIEEMVKQFVGLASSTAAGAAATITDFLEYASIEPDDDLLQSNHWQVYAKTTFDVTMPGMETMSTLSSDG